MYPLLHSHRLDTVGVKLIRSSHYRIDKPAQPLFPFPDLRSFIAPYIDLYAFIHSCFRDLRESLTCNCIHIFLATDLQIWAGTSRITTVVSSRVSVTVVVPGSVSPYWQITHFMPASSWSSYPLATS